MNPKRKKVQDYVITHLNKMDKSGKNAALYQSLFDSWSDSDFDKWMHQIKDKHAVLAIYIPNTVVHINIDDLIKEAKDIGVKLFHRLRLYDDATKTYYVTANEYCVLTLHVRRMAQFIDHKLSVPESDKKIDLLSGQVVAEDKSGSLNQVEVQSLYARGLTNTIRELIKFRGGDVTAFSEMKTSLEETGTTSIGKDTHSVVRSAVILDVLYSGIHIEANASGV